MSYPVVQTNGQRVYFPRPSSPSPPRGSEVFVGNLPRDLFEDELIPLFEEAGTIHKLRLMMDFSGSSRGFCFVTFTSLEEASEAVEMFDNYPMKRANGELNRITVHLSLDNCRLFFGNVPRAKSAAEIESDLRGFVDGVVRAIVYAEPKNSSLNRGFAFVEFESHAAAAIARRRMLAGVVDLWDYGDSDKVCVDWAEPEPIVSPMVLRQVKILYFKNVPVSWAPDRFKCFVRRMLSNINIARMYKKDNYAFVHFFTRNEAELALKMFNAVSEYLVFHGAKMEIEWARPVDYSRRNRNQLPETFCMSVPPKVRKLVQKCKLQPKKQVKNRVRTESTGSDLFTEIDIAVAEEYLAQQFQQLSLGNYF